MWGTLCTQNTILAIGTGISFLALIGLVINAVLVRRYVEVTEEIRDQAVHQTEGLARPALVFLAPDSEELRTLKELAPQRIRTDSGYARNIGSGPALDIQVTVSNQGKVNRQTVSHLPQGDAVELSNVLSYTVAAPGADVTAEYHSLGGAHYKSHSPQVKTASYVSTTITRTS